MESDTIRPRNPSSFLKACSSTAAESEAGRVGVFLQGRDGYVSRHDRHDTGPDHLPIGNPLDPFQPWAPHGNHRQRQMGIHLGIAVTRKMLGRCQHPGLLGSRDKCRTQTAHCLRGPLRRIEC